MFFTNFQKTIALTSGVLVLSCAIGLIVIAWTGPGAPPPTPNAPAPINVSSDAQTKAGDLTVANLSLKDGTGVGNITNARNITGGNDSGDDLYLYSDPGHKTEIYLDDGSEGIKLRHQGTDVLVVGTDDAVHLPELTDVADFDGCFLQIDEFGKISCYTGGVPPGGNVLSTAPLKVLGDEYGRFSSGTFCEDTIFLDEKVIKVYYYIRSDAGYSAWQYVELFINGSSKWKKSVSGVGTISGTYYYHTRSGDKVEICVDTDNEAWATGIVYSLGYKREFITHAFADEPKILYWYEQDEIGQMDESAGAHYKAPDILNPESVIISAKDEVDVTWILD